MTGLHGETAHVLVMVEAEEDQEDVQSHCLVFHDAKDHHYNPKHATHNLVQVGKEARFWTVEMIFRANGA